MASTQRPFNARRTAGGFAILTAIYFAVVLLPIPPGVTPGGWRLAGLFLATVAGLILSPIPGGALVLLAVTLAPVIGALGLTESLGGYADSTVWLVMAAFFISRSLLNTGLARRIALAFVRTFGKSSVGVCYSLGLSDTLLGAIIPSNGARSGGVTLPITRSIAELYGSTPEQTPRRLGAFLMVGVYQCTIVGAAMFYTGQASNPLAAQMAGNFGYPVTWVSWFAAAVVPGLVSLAVVPLIVLKIYPPEIRRTPEAAEFARSELVKMGPMSGQERILAAIFGLVCGMWATSAFHHVDITVTALGGSMALLLTGVLKWEDVINERAAWDIFIWYGGLVRLGKALNEAGVTKAFAESVGQFFSNLNWLALLVVALLIYYFAHYAFASITAHILAMYPAFVAVLLAKGAPIGLVVLSFAFLSSLAAGLTHYGTTPAPMFFGHGYVAMKDWWRVGAVVGVANLAIWGTVGFAYWKLIGLW
ncbi:MAG TPA: DASS family sodium-coupled anion symporter [Bryobacteraceae bacterium]|nr:DASS family sodium-coupled anion symporter [Bryobacteraceae bacterium]